MLLVAGLPTLALLRQPVDDLAFLEQWNPIRETRIGDFAHPGDGAYGTWTVLRFPDTTSFAYTLRGSSSIKPPEFPNLEEEFRKRMPSLFYVRMVFDVDYVDTIRNPDGGSDRYLWVENGMSPSGPDRYQVWIRQDSWIQRTWAAVKHRLGL